MSKVKRANRDSGTFHVFKVQGHLKTGNKFTAYVPSASSKDARSRVQDEMNATLGSAALNIVQIKNWKTLEEKLTPTQLNRMLGMNTSRHEIVLMK